MSDQITPAVNSSEPQSPLPPDFIVKYGGASLRGPSRLRLAARRIAELVRAGRVPVVVASAPGRTTDRLLDAADRINGPSNEPWIDSAPGRERDRLLATGEQRSATLLALALLRRGVSARSLSGPEAGIRVREDGHVEADPKPIRRLLHGGWIPIVAGFQAADAHGELRTLGRGGSDLTAVILAEALGAGECRLVKDVPGVFPHDPGADPAPEAVGEAWPYLEPDALVSLAAAGARVVQQAAAVRAREAEVRLRIHHFRAPALRPGGTVVAPARRSGRWAS